MPELNPVCRPPEISAVVHMPEASVYEDGQPMLFHDEVRRTRQFPVMEAIAQAGAVKSPTYQHFRSGVPATYGLHVPASGFLL